MKIILPESVKHILSRLNQRGFSAYAVGGCVRDMIMGRTPNDWDMCTSARPEELQAAFSDHRVIETGLKHGTLTVLVKGAPYEVTTYRIDGEYTDHRRPESVTFVSDLALDLARRDFTVNAMAADDGGIVDLYGGQEDIARKIIRCVGEPEARLTEDALRILRAVRFASTLDFTVHPDTAAAMKRLAPTLGNVSMERIWQELKKFLLGPGCGRLIGEFPEVIRVFLPEADLSGDIDRLPREFPLRLAHLLRNLPVPEAERILKRLKSDNDTLVRVKNACAGYAMPLPTDRESALRLLAKAGETGALDACALRGADDGQVLAAIAEGACYSVKMLAVTGRDLAAVGIKNGPGMGRTLAHLLEEVISGRTQNEQEALLALALAHTDEEVKP